VPLLLKSLTEGLKKVEEALPQIRTLQEVQADCDDWRIKVEAAKENHTYEQDQAAFWVGQKDDAEADCKVAQAEWTRLQEELAKGWDTLEQLNDNI